MAVQLSPVSVVRGKGVTPCAAMNPGRLSMRALED